MVRMLGFSDEDKQRIGGAQQGAGKGVVRGVLGLPGRLVGGILGGGSAESSASTASDNQVIFWCLLYCFFPLHCLHVVHERASFSLPVLCRSMG